MQHSQLLDELDGELDNVLDVRLVAPVVLQKGAQGIAEDVGWAAPPSWGRLD